MGKKVLAAKSGRAACSCAAAGGGIGAKNAKDAKSFLTGLTGFTGLREASVKPAKTKPSGVAWIGDVPVGWEVRRLKDILARPLQYGASESGIAYDEALPRYIRITDITLDGRLKDKGVLSLTEESASDYILQDQDILLARSGATVGKAFLYEKQMGRAAFAGYLIRATVDVTNALPRFVYYTTLGCGYDDWRNSIAVSATIQNIGADKYNNYSLPMPPLTVQRAIAAYLDEKCGAIDVAIAEAKKGIEEYKAWKISLIDDVVCNGIVRHDVRKETGEVWLEDIPGEWDFTQIRYLFALRDERNDKPLKDVNLISLYTDKGVVQHADLEKTTGNKASTADGYKLVYENDIVVNIILCWMGAVGRSAYNGVTSPAYDVYRPIDPTKVLSRYYHYLFRTPRFNGKCYEEGRGIMMMRWRTYSSEFRAIKVPVPPFEEQQAIADYLDEKCAAIDAMVAEKEALIADLEAYKKSLIFEVVTGKCEVA